MLACAYIYIFLLVVMYTFDLSICFLSSLNSSNINIRKHIQMQRRNGLNATFSAPICIACSRIYTTCYALSSNSSTFAWGGGSDGGYLGGLLWKFI